MWGVQGVAQRQEPLHPPLARLLVCVRQTSFLFAPGSHTPASPLVALPSHPPLVCIHPTSPSHSPPSLCTPALPLPSPCFTFISPPSCWSPGLCALASFSFAHTLTLLVPSPPVHVCWLSRQPPGSHALSALCLHLLVSTTWSRSLGIHLLGFFSCSFGFVYPLVGLFLGSLASHLYL